jgi:dihydrofolate reductase
MEESRMRRIIAAEFMTLDGVTEAADQWHFPYVNEEMGAEQSALMADTDTMLLGRRTYEEFAVAWPSRTSADFGPLADFMNSTPKVVVSATLKSVEWQNSKLLEGDLAEGLTKLKQQSGKTIFVPGSATLVKSLLRANLLDELRLFVDPILVGKGRRIFESGNGPVALKLASSKTFTTGVLSLTYLPAGT